MSPNHLVPELAWLRESLWNPSTTLLVGAETEFPADFLLVDSYALFPNGRRPRQLLPLGSRQAAAATLRRYHMGMGRYDRWRRKMLAMGLEAGLVQPLLRHRLQVAMPSAETSCRPAAILKHHLEDVLGETELELTVTFGPMRANRKPVLQLLTKRGKTICYVKVGWNSLTSHLITSEATTLAWLAQRPLKKIAVAHVVHRGEWSGRQLAVLSPLSHECGGGGRGTADSPIAAMAEIAGIAGTRSQSLGTSSWWRETKVRMGRVHAASQHGKATALVAERLEDKHGGDVLLFGYWHGDFTPWNTGWAGGRLQVWDWERSRTDVPVGFDALHWTFQQAFQGRQRNVEAGLAGARSVSHQLPALGALEGSQPLLLVLYLIELYLRYAEDWRTSDDPTLGPVCHALVKAIAREMGTDAHFVHEADIQGER